MKFHSTSRGCNVYRNARPGLMRWSAYVNGAFVNTDTLAGIRGLIAETLEKG